MLFFVGLNIEFNENTIFGKVFQFFWKGWITITKQNQAIIKSNKEIRGVMITET